MSLDAFSNNATGLTTVALGSEDTVITLPDDGSADRFADLPEGRMQRATLSNPALPGQIEIVYITAKDGSSFTVNRRQENSYAAEDWPAGTTLEARITAGMLGRFLRADSRGIFKTTGGEGGAGASSFVVNGKVERDFRVVQLSGVQMLHRIGAGLTTTIGAGRYIQDMNLSVETVGGSCFVALGDDVPVWQPNQSYQGLAIVAPPTPTGFNYLFEPSDVQFQYTRSAVDPGFDDSGYAIEAYNPNSGEGAEPELTGQWLPLPIPLALELSMPSVAGGVALTEVGFICYEYDATTAPVISIGLAADGDLVNAQALSAITGARHIQRFAVNPGGALAASLAFKLETPATGRFYGRFYWRGMVIDQ
ncbi:hypothetical protein M2375_000946 [Comamonas sp. BIGb0152]|uniref:hypothetical protein n=1 Tax=Comamonas sp. BIGb0152 TaxID=2940601 RepID=UPI002169D82B|nr:hypothetical protein [Comamonas sp. BIGb0152]MCS4292740.1 hypothetical protein [Comamonas sp. BIGb0152]